MIVSSTHINLLEYPQFIWQSPKSSFSALHALAKGEQVSPAKAQSNIQLNTKITKHMSALVDAMSLRLAQVYSGNNGYVSL